MSLKRNEFVEAYIWYFTETDKKANEIYDKAVCCADRDFINEIITIYKDNAPVEARLYD